MLGLPWWLSSNEHACNAGDSFRSLGWKDPLEEGWATHSSVLVWRIPWTEEPGGLQSLRSQRIGHDQVTFTFSAGLGFPGGSVIKNPPANAGDMGSVPELGP